MQVSVVQDSPVQKTVTITVDATVVQEQYKKVFLKFAKTARVDGFRKGHIPTKVIEGYYGHKIWADAVDAVVNATLPQALKDNQLEFLGTPDIELDKNTKLDKNSELSYIAKLEVWPDVDLEKLSSLEFELINSKLTDENVSEMIEILRKRNAKWQNVEGEAVATEHSKVNVDYVGRKNGEEFEGGKAEGAEIILDAKRMIPGFCEGIVGHKVGETFTITTKFPDDYFAKELAGQETQFEIKINSVAERLLDADDVLAKNFGIESGSMDELRENLRQNMQITLNQTTDSLNTIAVGNAIAEAYADLALPKALLESSKENLFNNKLKQLTSQGLPENMAKRLMEGERENMFKEGSSLLKAAEHQSIVAAVYRKVSEDTFKSGALKVEQSEINDKIAEYASAYENSAEYIAEVMKDPDAVRGIVDEIAQAKITEYIGSKSTKVNRIEKTFFDVCPEREY